MNSQKLYIDIDNLNTIDLTNIISKSPHLLSQIYNDLKTDDLLILLKCLNSVKLKQAIYFIPNNIFRSIIDLDINSYSFNSKLLNLCSNSQLISYSKFISLDECVEILLLLSDVNDYYEKFNIFYFNLKKNIQNFIKNKLNHREINILLTKLNNKFYIENFLDHLDPNSKSFKYLINNISNVHILNHFIYFMNANQVQKTFNYINHDLSLNIIDKFDNSIQNNPNFNFNENQLPSITETLVYLNYPTSKKLILDILYNFNTKILKIILPIISPNNIKITISKLSLLKLTEIIPFLTPLQISKIINNIDLYYFKSIFPLLTEKQLFHSFKNLTNSKFWRAIEIITFDKLCIIIPTLSNHQIQIFLEKINNLNIETMDVFIPYLSNQIVCIMLSIPETKDIIINHFQYLTHDQIFYSISVLNINDLIDIIFMDNHIDLILLNINQPQSKQLYTIVYDKLLKNIKSFEELNFNLNIIKNSIDQLLKKIESINDQNISDSSIRDIDFIINKTSKNIREFVSNREFIYSELNIFKKLKFLFHNDTYIDKLDKYSIDTKFVFLKFKNLCNTFHINSTDSLLTRWEKIKNKSSTV
jgi:hypothetical protein